MSRDFNKIANAISRRPATEQDLRDAVTAKLPKSEMRRLRNQAKPLVTKSAPVQFTSVDAAIMKLAFLAQQTPQVEPDPEPPASGVYDPLTGRRVIQDDARNIKAQ